MTIAFIPTEERVMLRDSVRRAVQGKALDWTRCAELGWLAVGLPESAGGLSGDPYDMAVIAEEFGRASITLPVIETACIAVQALHALAPGDPWLDQIGTGALRVALAHDEAGLTGEAAPVATQASRAGRGFELSGRKSSVLGAPEADLLLVSAMLPGEGLSLFALRPEPTVLSIHRTIDDRSAADIVLDRTPADGVALIGAPGGAAEAVRRALDFALVLGAADALGAMQAALELTRDYLLIRQQHGQRIGDFQALRHRLADMFIETEQARSLVLRALAALSGEDQADRTRLAAAAKVRTAQAGRVVTGQAIQLHGGIGVTEEYPLGRHFRRILAFDLRYGTAAAHVGRFARLP